MKRTLDPVRNYTQKAAMITLAIANIPVALQSRGSRNNILNMLLYKNRRALRDFKV